MNPINAWKDKAIALLERLDKWWNKTAKPQLIHIEKTPDYLAGRVICCANCFDEAQYKIDEGQSCAGLSVGRSTLWRYRGRVVCSVCNSDNWFHPIGFSAWYLNK